MTRGGVAGGRPAPLLWRYLTVWRYLLDSWSTPANERTSMPDAITLTLDRPVADDLLMRLLETPLQEGDGYECYMIVLLADALGVHVGEMIRRRAAVFAS